MKTIPVKENQQGFTLVEVMISMFFIMFIIQGTAMISMYAQRSGVYARRLTSANILAEQALEKFRNTDYDNLATFHNQQVCFNANMTQMGACGAGATFTQTTLVTAGPTANISQVDVTVTWEEYLGWNARLAGEGPYEAKVVSYISKY